MLITHFCLSLAINRIGWLVTCTTIKNKFQGEKKQKEIVLPGIVVHIECGFLK